MTILVCGEALFDVFLSEAPEPGRLSFDARAAGSPYNVAIGLARLGAGAALLTGVSTDLLGDELARHLAAEGVDAGYLRRVDRPTTLSLVGLDGAGRPSYAFYGVGSADTALTEADLPVLTADVAALHFGSYSIAVPPTADAFAALAAREQSRFVSLDPNIRPTIEPERAVWSQRIDALRPSVNLIKASAEDLAWLSPETSPRDVAQGWARDGADLVVLTDGGEGVVAFRGETAITVPTLEAQIVDAVGAGDAFQAALLAELERAGALAADLGGLPNAELETILSFAARAAAIVCGRRGADPPRREEL